MIFAVDFAVGISAFDFAVDIEKRLFLIRERKGEKTPERAESEKEKSG